MMRLLVTILILMAAMYLVTHAGYDIVSVIAQVVSTMMAR